MNDRDRRKGRPGAAGDPEPLVTVDWVGVPSPGELHRELTAAIIGVFYQVYNELGQGFLESIYESAMTILLEELGFGVERQKPIAVYFRGRKAGDFRIDLAVNGSVALELKCCRAIDPIHKAQLVNYLAATRFEVGLLLNFGPKPEVCRMVMTNDRKTRARRG